MSTQILHNPLVGPGSSSGYGNPSVNKILSVTYTDGANDASFTEQTYFETTYPHNVAVSIFAVNEQGDQVSATDFAVDLFRSIDGGYSWQLFKEYSGPTEEFLESPVRRCRWQFRLKTKGIANVRVRAAT